MKKPVVIGIILVAFLGILLSATAVFYSIPFVKLNNLVAAANKQPLYLQDTPLISAQNYRKLSLVTEEEKNDETYIQIKTKKRFQIESISSIAFNCDISVSIRDFESWEVIDQRNALKKVRFAFVNGEWKVKEVE